MPESLTQFKANGPAAEDDQFFGKLLQTENIPIGEEGNLRKARNRRNRGRRPGGDHNMFSGDGFALDRDGMAVVEDASALEDIDAKRCESFDGIMRCDGPDNAADSLHDGGRVHIIQMR